MTCLPTLLAGATLLLGLPAAPEGYQADLALPVEVGLGVTDVVVTDLDGDGSHDVVIAARASDGTILLGNGTGGHTVVTAPVLGADQLPGGDFIRYLVAGDFDGDGHADLVAQQGDDSFHFLLFRGDGSGSLLAPTIVESGIFLDRPASADFNEDGLSDLVSTSSVSIHVTLADGLGSFLAPLTIHVLQGPRQGVVTGDFDEDGHTDILVAAFGPGPKVFVYPGNGDGTFGEPVRSAVAPLYPFGALASGDLDDDGHLDCVLLQNVADGTVLRGDGAGGFVAVASIPRDRYSLSDAVIGDQDGDGWPDLMLLAEDLTVLRNDGKGNLVFSSRHMLPGSEFDRILAADFDRDGRSDFVCASTSLALPPPVGSVVLLRSDGGDALETARALEGGEDTRVAIGDFDRDSVLDIAAVDRFEDAFTTFRGDGAGGFLPGQAVPGLAAGIDPRNVLSGDVDGDGDLDLVVTYAQTARVSTFLGDGDGSFAPPIDWFAAELVRVESSLLDVNGDGRADLVARSSSFVRLYLSQSDGSFVLSGVVSTEGAAAPPVTADVDENGHADLILMSTNGRGTLVLLGDGTGGFTESDRIPTHDYAGAVLDVDRDGHLDIAVTRAVSVDHTFVPMLFISHGHGDGSFAPPVAIAPMFYRASLTPIRLDDDAATDLLADTRDDGILLLRSTSPDAFEEIARIPGTQQLQDVEIEDLDGDGLDDIVAVHFLGSRRILLNRTAFFECRRGAINAGAGPVTDVLFVNGSAGNGRSRVIRVDHGSPFELRIDATPAGGNRYVAYAWRTAPEPRDVSPLFAGTSSLCLPIVFHGASGRRAPAAIWKTIPGHAAILGEGTLPAGPAPAVLASLPGLPRGGIRLFVQAIMEDPGARNGVGDVTNGIEIRVR